MNSRKLHALLSAIHPSGVYAKLLEHLDPELKQHLETEQDEATYELAVAIASASDRVNLEETSTDNLPNKLRHSLSGQERDFMAEDYAANITELASILNNFTAMHIRITAMQEPTLGGRDCDTTVAASVTR